MWAPETLEEEQQEACGRGIAAPPSEGHHPSGDSSVLVPDTPVASVYGVEGHVSGTLAVPDTQDSPPSSCVHMREESKEEEDLFSAEEVNVDTAQPCSFSLQLSSQLSAAAVGSQQDLAQPTGESAAKEDSSSSTTTSSSSAGAHSHNQPSSGDSSGGGAGVGGAGGGGAGAEGHRGGGWTTSGDADSTQERGGQSQMSSPLDSVVVLDNGSTSVPDVRQSGEVPVGANEDVIVLGDSLTVEETAPTADDYEGETLPYSAAVEEEVGGDEKGEGGEGSPDSKVGEEGAGQKVVSSDCSSDSKSTSANPFQFTTTRSPSKRTDPVKQSASKSSTSEPREAEDSGHHHEDVAMETEPQAAAGTQGRQGSFVLAGKSNEQQSSSDSEFVLPAVQVQNESQSQFQDAFLFQPSFRINSGSYCTAHVLSVWLVFGVDVDALISLVPLSNPLGPTVPTTSSGIVSPQTPPTFTGHLATHPDQL